MTSHGVDVGEAKVNGHPVMLMVVVAALIAAMLPSSGCTAAPSPPKVTKKATIALTQLIGSASIYVAREKGYFTDEGVDATFVIYPSGGLAIAAVAGGEGDLATAAETPIVRSVLGGAPMVVVASISEVKHSNVIVARKDAGISLASDLKGKRIGVARGTSADFFLHLYLTTSRIDPGSVRIVPRKPDEVVTAITNGQVDAVSTWAPYTTSILSDLGSNAIVLDEPGLYTMWWNVVARRDLTTRDPDLLVRLLRAIVRGTEYVEQHPGEAQAITSKATGIGLAGVRSQWADYRPLTMLDQSLLLAMEDEARWMRSTEPTAPTGIPNFLDSIYTEALRVVSPAAVKIVE